MDLAVLAFRKTKLSMIRNGIPLVFETYLYSLHADDFSGICSIGKYGSHTLVDFYRADFLATLKIDLLELSNEISYRFFVAPVIVEFDTLKKRVEENRYRGNITWSVYNTSFGDAGFEGPNI